MAHLIKGFQQHFSVVRADSPELIEQSFALRHQVYCVERAFEVGGAADNGRESDPYDRRAMHSLVHHRASGRYVASVRLVLADGADPRARFPIETLCDGLYRTRQFLCERAPAFRVAEISRFAVSKQRRAAWTAQAGAAGDGISPHATLGLFNGIVRMSAEAGITHWYALMEPTETKRMN